MSIGKSYRRLEAVLTLLSVARLLIPKLDIFLEEDVAMVLNNFKVFAEFDWICLFWIPVLNVLAEYLKKKKRANWLLPIPVLIVLASFAICGVIGCFRLNLFATKNFVEGIVYAVFNGIVIASGAIVLYDLVKSLVEEAYPKVKAWILGIIAKAKEKKEVKENG